MKIIGQISLVILILLTAACSRRPDRRLLSIYELTDTAPHQALAALDSIDCEALPASDRDFYDFVHLKASDKAYITHTSDSIILRLLDRYEGDSQFGPEVLYYAGRVYSDLGDYPSSLDYFHDALDATPTNKNPRLRGHILSQTGRLLDKLRIYDEAIPYMKEVIELDSLMGDTTNLVYNHQLLGAIYMRNADFDRACIHINRALALTPDSIDTQKARNSMYLAAIALKCGKTDSALNLIRGVPERVKPQSQNMALAYAAEIYLKAGITDTARMYATELINSPNTYHRAHGYHVLLSPDLSTAIHHDSMSVYLHRYHIALETIENQNNAEMVRIQQAFYNYDLHESQRIEAEWQKTKAWIAVGCCFILIMFLACVVLALKIRNNKRLLELHVALSRIRALTAELKRSEEQALDNKIEVYIQNSISSPASEEQLRERLRKKLIDLAQDSEANTNVGSVIVTSPVVHSLKEAAARNEIVPENSPIWEELEKVIICQSPKFKSNLYLLTGNILSAADYRTMMLLRCGFTPKEMSILFGRDKNTMGSRRKVLCNKLFNCKLELKTFDSIVRML